MSDSNPVEALRGRFRADQLLTATEEVAAYGHDDGEWAPWSSPVAVLLAESTEDVVDAVSIARAAGLRVVARGAGTGLSGAANAMDDAVVVSLERMRAILEVNVDERYVVTQPGILNNELRLAMAEHGLWYPPDPASMAISTIGGNVATNAGGICCVKYGVTRDYVLALRVVLADGSVARLGRRTAKGVTGYDLVGLLVGSEGTLGIVIEITLRLLPLAGREDRAIIGSFPSLKAAGEAVAAVSREGIIPAALELIDSTCIAAVNDWQDLGLPTDADTLLLARVDETGESGARLADRIAELFAANGGSHVEHGESAEEVDRLFLARRLAYPSLERLGPVLTEDVCVPRGSVPEMLARIQATAARHDVRIANIAHAGDGNLHPLIIAPEGDEAATGRARAAFEEIVSDCLDLGGTVTGEHGVGLLKRVGAERELGPVVLGMHRAIKQALDPDGILNPGNGF